MEARDMQTLLVTVLVIGLSMAAMAIGVILSNRELKGSCGGTGRDCSCSAEARRDCALAGEARGD
jgi:hypothetical protein